MRWYAVKFKHAGGVGAWRVRARSAQAAANQIRRRYKHVTIERVRLERRRHNPQGDATSYWLALGALLVGGVAIAAWKNMSDRQKTAALP